FYEKYWKRYDTAVIEQKIATARKQRPCNRIELETWRNQLATITAIERMARKEYGRTLNPSRTLRWKDRLAISPLLALKRRLGR
ncbi:MAG: hypothetical protein IJ125_09010, partial [Atopobiaceae bacterium]|nr:hypothetical protein [Atopobiaceae bacterium]